MSSQFRVQSAKDVVTDAIRELIHDGTMTSGDRVSIDELAERFGVSRTPVRDALQQLSVEGLVTITPRVGVFVREISRQEITDVYQIQTALEPLMAAWAAVRGTAEQRAEFLRSVADLERSAKDGDVAGCVELLDARREALLTMAGSGGLRDALGVLDGRVQLLRFRNLSRPGRLTESAAQHRAVAEAIDAGDERGAAAAMQAHMQRETERVHELLTSGDDAPTLAELDAERPKKGRRRSAAAPGRISASTATRAGRSRRASGAQHDAG